MSACTFIKRSTSSHEKIEQIDYLMNYAYENGIFNGSILVADSGKVIYKKSFGQADFRTYETMDSKTTFYIASLTKSFTAMAILILQERALLNIDDPIVNYLPELSSFASTVTIRQLLTHTSGIPDYFRFSRQRIGLKNSDIIALLKTYNKVDFLPGEEYSYSNSAYVILSEIIQKISQQSYQSFLKENIFDPLGMKGSFVYDTDYSPIINRAVGFNKFRHLDDYINLTTGDVGVFSTLDDLYLWDQALYSHKLISESTFEESIQATRLRTGKIANYGFGWAIQYDGISKSLIHTGRIAGYRTQFNRYLDTKSTLILLTNNGEAYSSQIATALDNIISDRPYELPRIPLSVKIVQMLKDDFIENIMPEVYQIIEEKNPKYIINEADLNQLGYSFVRVKDTDYEAAALIFKLNKELFPESSNVYDSYGESMMLLGKKDDAVRNYRKSIQLNPNHFHGYRKLYQLEADSIVTVNLENFDYIVGKYVLNDKLILDITRRDNHLYTSFDNGYETEIFPISETKFYQKSSNVDLEFKINVFGKVWKLIAVINGRIYEYKKVE